jgi:hypothetical protein
MTAMTTRQTSGAMGMANALLLALILCFTPVATGLGIPWVGYDWGNWHTFVVPHLALSGILLTFYACGIAANIVNRQLRAVAGWVQPFLAATDIWAMSRWPGGDDGGGMSWLLIVGPVTAAILIIGAFVAAGQRSGERRVAARARTLFCVGAAVGFGVWTAIPWVDILLLR